MYAVRKIVAGLVVLTMCLPYFSSFAQESKSESKTKTPANTKRAKEIFSRTKVLTASVVTTSKGAKGVGAPISDRAAWEAVAKAPAFKNIVADAEKRLNEPIPGPTLEDYMLFYDQENLKKFSEFDRTYQNKFDYRRNRFFQLVIAECIENKGRFLPAIEEIIMVISAEPAWTIPWDDGEAKMFKGETKRIDHNVARTAWNLATADYWLGKKLSANTRDNIREIIEERVFSIFEEAITTDNYALIPWAQDANNWNADCHAAIVGSALALIDSPERRANYLAAAEVNVEKFLQIFSKDGYFPDGMWAWNVGYGSFIMLAEVFYQSTGGRIDMFKRPNIKETALYAPRMEIAPGVFVSFGDRWAGDRPNMAPTAFVSKRFQMGLTEIENRAPFFGVGPGQLFTVGIYCFPNSATQQKGEIGKTVTPPLETFRDDFPLNGVMILRTGKKERNQLAVQLKGGNNDERGNHSDVGGYVVAIGGGAPLTDVGSRAFRRGLHVKDKMDSNTYNSFGHPVPKIDGLLQKNGKGTVAPLLDRQYTDDVDLLKFDLQYVYAWAEPKDLKECTRTFIYNRTGKDTPTPGQTSFTVTDTFKAKKPLSFENCLITFGPFKKLTEDPEATSIELIIGRGDQAVLVTVTNEVLEKSEELNKFVKHSRPLVFEAADLDEMMPRNDTNPLRLSFGFGAPVDDATMTIVIRPAPKDKRDVAQKSPDAPSKTYTSTIDTDLAIASDGGAADAERMAKLVDGFKARSPVPLETLLKLSDDELKTILRGNPVTKNASDADIEALIKAFRDSQ